MPGNEILLLRKGIADTLRTALSPVDVQEHPRAEMTSADLDSALKNKYVAIRVAFVGAAKSGELNSNEVDAPFAWAVYVAAKDTAPTEPRDVVTLGLLPAIMLTVAQADWTAGADEANNVETGRVDGLSARQLYQGEIDTKSALLWVVEWRQKTILKPPLPDDLRDLLTLITRYDLHPKDGTIDAVDEIDMRHEDP